MVTRARRYDASDLDTAEKVASAFLDRDTNEREAQRSAVVETYFTDLKVGNSGAKVMLRHSLGRRARWEVVDWKRTTSGGWHGLERFSDDGNTLTLASYIDGVATVRVF